MELYAGIGTLSFPLAAHAIVQAYEGSPEAAAALRRAAGGTRVQATHRDLARQPLQASELAGVAALVLDPPFAGAPLQMPSIVAARVPTVIYVSCNPVALGRMRQCCTGRDMRWRWRRRSISFCGRLGLRRFVCFG